MAGLKTPELLAPAGSPEALDAAVGEGADAVYLGLKDFNARLRSTNFTYAQFEGALRSLRRMKKKVYVTVNTVFEQREADRMYQLLKYLDTQQPDALIVQDFGVVEMARSQFPSLRLHASTQMNIASAAGANILSRHGISRVVLARELSLEELRSIKSETNLELEVFVHGALCISVSGICLFSSFLGGKSANRGLCTQACRRLYHQEEKSGYYFSPDDLQLIEHIPDLAEAGIAAFKIEGRMKSAGYAGAVVSAYRLVLDAAMNGNEDEIKRSIETGTEILRNDFARPKTKYFFNGAKESPAINWLNPDQDSGTGINLGTIIKVKGQGSERLALVSPPAGIVPAVRDSVRFHLSGDKGRISHKLNFVRKEGKFYWISAPKGAQGDNVYLIQTKTMAKRYAPVTVQIKDSRGPGREKAPNVQFSEKAVKKQNEIFTEGLYIAVSKPEDLYVVQSSRPQKVILDLSEKNSGHLLADNKTPLPFKPAEIILNLDPWFPQEIADLKNGRMSEEIKLLIEKGFLYYIVNNPGHFPLFRGYDKVKLIAGPWLYIFNTWSLSFVSSLGVEGFVSPLENSRQNLERTLYSQANTRAEALHAEKKSRYGESKTRLPQQSGKKTRKKSALHSKFFITVFAWPPLFNIKANLAPFLKLDKFSDNRGESFRLLPVNDGTRVYPEKYFSIIDKIPFLKEAGFGRFIIDLTGNILKKQDYRDLINAVNKNAPLPQSSRFNWKNGFYSNAD